MDDYSLLEAYLDQVCRQQAAFGAAVVVVQDAGNAYTQCIGTHDGLPVTLDTPIPVASLTKPVFACLVLQLIERGLLDLDTPLAQYLPTPYLPDEPFLHLMTARHALSHTTGFPNWRDETGLRSAFHPGSAFSYSTEGMLYLQTVIEHLTRQPLEECIEQNMFAPLGMEHSRLVPEDLSRTNPCLPAGLRAYGGVSLQTTAPDYARFLLAMFQPGAAGGPHLMAATLAQMLAPQARVGDQQRLSWGLGWGIQHAGPEDSFWHFGVRRGRTFNFALGYPKARSGLVILTSQTLGMSICEEIARAALGPSRPLPAFEWLLPPKHWRADGRKPTEKYETTIH